MMKNILLTFSMMCLAAQLYATHIVGGSLIYEHISDSTYRVSIRLYKDCSPQSINFSTTIRLEIRNGDGSLPATSFVRLPLLTRDTLDPHIDTCAFNPGVCVELGVYSKIITLPGEVDGYHLFYTDCCRNGSVVNIVSPLTYGEGLHTYIPDRNTYPSNSSPVFTTNPPVYVCKDQDLNYDFSAMDADGDSLVYTLIKPYHGLNEYSGPPYNSGVPYSSLLPTISATGTPPDNITFNTIAYLPGFSETNPLNAISGNGLTLSSSGLLTGVPEMVGQYLVAVKVDEYRNGVKIGTIVRDFQYNVLDCPPPKDAAIGDIDVCSGLNVQMVNESGAGANGFWWDFGTGNIGDTSTLEEPTFTFPGIGTYDLTLMAQKGTLCADTAYLQIKLSNITGQFISGDDTLCIGEPIELTSNSFTSTNDVISYIAWSFDGVDLDTGVTVNYAFNEVGDHEIKMIAASDNGCLDTVVKMVYVNTVPVADFSPTLVCNSQDVQFSNLSSAHAKTFFWDFGTGVMADSSILDTANFSFPAYGEYTVTLISDKGTACADTVTRNIQLHDIEADFTMQDTVCGMNTVNFQDASVSTVTNINGWQWDFGDMNTASTQDYQHNYASPGTYDIQLIASTATGCEDTIVKTIEVLGVPVVDAGADTAMCISAPSVTLTSTHQNSGGIVWEGNGGTFSPDNSTNTIDYTPSAAEIANGETYIVLHSSMNPHCQEVNDTIRIDIIETPVISTMSDITVCENETSVAINGSIVDGDQTIWTSTGTGIFTTPMSLMTNYEPSATDKLNGSVDLILSSTNIYGCMTSEDTLTISFAPIPQVDITGLDTICYLDSLDLISNSNTGDGVWSTLGDSYFSPSDTGATTTFFAGQADSDLGSATIIFNSLNNSGCPAATDTARITILPLPDVNFEISTSCFGSLAELVDLSSFTEPIIAWEWSVEDSTYITNAPSHEFSDTGYFDVTLTVTTARGCQNTATLPIRINGLPSVDFIVPEPCIYGAFFEDKSTVDSLGQVSWLWYFGDGDSANVQNPVHQYDSIGDYTVTLIVESGIGCMDTITQVVSIYPPPVSLFTFFPNPAKVGETVSFNSQSHSTNAPIVTWDWDFDNGSTSTLINPSTTFSEGGAYTVALVVHDEVGCRDTSFQEVLITHGPKVPGAFSPNGDGINDYLMIMGTGFEEINFRIYNNWGGLLFQTEDINDKGWDGTFNGEPQPLGVYVYTAWVKNAFGQEIEISGDVTIVK